MTLACSRRPTVEPKISGNRNNNNNKSKRSGCPIYFYISCPWAVWRLAQSRCHVNPGMSFVTGGGGKTHTRQRQQPSDGRHCLPRCLFSSARFSGTSGYHIVQAFSGRFSATMGPSFFSCLTLRVPVRPSPLHIRRDSNVGEVLGAVEGEGGLTLASVGHDSLGA